MQFLLLVFALFVSVNASARVLVRKDFISKYPVAEQQNVFEYLLVNTGDTAAFNVSLSDRDSFPTNRFQVMNGSLDARFPVILPNATAFHYVIVVPHFSHPISEKDVVVEYTDSKTKTVSRVTTTWNSKEKYTHYLPKDAIKSLDGSSAIHFFAFASLAGPLTFFCGLFYLVSKRRYSAIKKNN